MNLQEAATRLLEWYEGGKLAGTFRLVNLGRGETAPGEGAPKDFDIPYETLSKLNNAGGLIIFSAHKTVTTTRTIGTLKPRERSETHEQLIGWDITLLTDGLKRIAGRKPENKVLRDVLVILESGYEEIAAPRAIAYIKHELNIPFDPFSNEAEEYQQALEMIARKKV